MHEGTASKQNKKTATKTSALIWYSI